MRLDRFLAQSGAGYKKDARILVKSGVVTVNGVTVTAPYEEIDEKNDVVYVGKDLVKYQTTWYFMFNKPGNCICACSDLNKKTVMEYFSDTGINGLFPVGRLDKDTEGLLFVTNDGDFCQRLMHPDFHVSKEYFFCVVNEVTNEAVNNLAKGVFIDDTNIRTCPGYVKVLETDFFRNIADKSCYGICADILPPNYNPIVSVGTIIISEGKKHQVKRMLASQNNRVIFLKRNAIGSVRLDEKLQPGEYRILKNEEINQLYAL